MHRTSNRPMVTGEITPRNGLRLRRRADAALSTLWFALVVNWLSAALSLGAIVMYAVGYTMILKRRTAQNIVWGGAAGCMPVLIGWSAVTDSVSWSAVILFLVIFFWTPPHYWPLSMRFKDDYAAAHVPMLPVVEKFVVVARQIVAYSWAMVAASLLLVPVAPMGWIYLGHGRRDRRAVHRRGAPSAAAAKAGEGPGAAAHAAVPLLDQLRGDPLPGGRGRPAGPPAPALTAPGPSDGQTTRGRELDRSATPAGLWARRCTPACGRRPTRAGPARRTPQPASPASERHPPQHATSMPGSGGQGIPHQDQSALARSLTTPAVSATTSSEARSMCASTSTSGSPVRYCV